MSDKEKLHFNIGMSATWWSKKLKYSVLINDTLVKNGEVTTDSDEIFFIEFDYQFEENTNNKLSIRLDNKTIEDTIENDDKTFILKDMLLHINSLSIDEIDVGQLKWLNSQFVGDEKDRPILKNCVDLGWNGAWEFPFDSPFYIWLLENM
jgi:hypothetical protein